MMYAFKNMPLEHAEDIVQEAFSNALIEWKKQGTPFNATGWLYRVCKNKGLNEARERARMSILSEVGDISMVATDFSESVLDDQQLKLLFACAHPDLSPKIQVVITLKYVINLKVEAIAKVLALTIDGVDKLLVRARKKIQSDKILLSVPLDSELRDRLPIVHKVIYLIFNEGYKSSCGNELMREDLCEEALILTKSLLDCDRYDHDTLSLYALMLFHAARFKSRFAADGALLDLEQQDRNLWNRDLIAMGNFYLQKSKSERLSKFHIEAYITYLHCTAQSFEATDWMAISRLYSNLLSDNANPFVELNYAIALYFSGENEKAFYILNELEKQPYMSKYYLLNATIGRLYAREGKIDSALSYLSKAVQQTHSTLEKDFINNIIRENTRV